MAASKASLSELLTQIAIFFTKAGAFVFGSGLAIVPFLYGGVVKEYGWLNDQQFLDAVAVAMITPGPVVITVGFIGYMVTAEGACFKWITRERAKFDRVVCAWMTERCGTNRDAVVNLIASHACFLARLAFTSTRRDCQLRRLSFPPYLVTQD